MSEGTVLLLDELATLEGPAAEAVRGAGATPVCVKDWRSAQEKLRSGEVVAVVFPGRMRQFEELCLEVRSDLSGSEDLPLIAVVPDAWIPMLSRLFMFSIDDFVTTGDQGGLEPKLRALMQGNPWANLRPESGRVIVADPDRGRRVLYGRLLRRKGLGVDFAVDRDDLARQVADTDDVRLILTTGDLPPRGARVALEAARAEGGALAALPWVIGGTPEQLAALGVEAEPATVRVFDHTDPPESVLFHVNELLTPALGDERRSARLLYGGPAVFRPMGDPHPVPAFSYNINRTGVFIRTLVPPPPDTEVNLELRPPFGEGRVKVTGRVVWRKECRQEGGPVVPTGMGVLYTSIPLADGAALDAGYAELLRTTPGAG